jgi:deoxyadenosine/deoxycytidine kinase
MSVQLVTVEGNIGSGKSTIARHAANYMPNTRFFSAPDPQKNPHWAAFQSEPKKHALAMQCWYLRDRLRVYVAALRHMESERQSVIIDFSLWSDIIFAFKHRESGFMTAKEFDEYLGLWRDVCCLNLPPPHLSIVLRAQVCVCLHRVEMSATRRAEPLLTEAYLQRVDELYNQRYLRDLDKEYKPSWLKELPPQPSEARELPHKPATPPHPVRR